MSTTSSKILVTGASGNLGGLVLHHLTETYHYPKDQIIAASRNPESLSQWADLGIETRKADFSDPESLESAFKGVDRVLLISTDSPVNDVRTVLHHNAVEALKSAGVPYIIYTSMPEPETSPVSFSNVHLTTENEVKASGASWTILRNAWYFENLLFTLPGALAGGSLYSAAGEGKISYISRSDLARAAAAALLSTSIENKTLTITGEEALSVDTVASQVSSLVGKPISVVHVPAEAIVEGALAHGLPPVVAEMFASFDRATQSGHLGGVTDEYEQLTGVKPQSFESWLNDNGSLFSESA